MPISEVYNMDCMEYMATLPDKCFDLAIVDKINMIRSSRQLQTGKAGEYLVCADLIMKGFIAFPSEQGLPYDVIVDNGEKLLKVQVKNLK